MQGRSTFLVRLRRARHEIARVVHRTGDLGTLCFATGDYETARRYWQPTADRGDADSQYNLGLLYAGGLGVPRNDQEAAGWYRRAAEQGLASGQHSLSCMFAEGRGVAQDDREAAAWEVKAARQGYSLAQYGLGTMHQFGRGVEQDHSEAAHWYRMAADQGNTEAKHALGLLCLQGLGMPKDYREAHRLFTEVAAAIPPDDADWRGQVDKNRDQAAALIATDQNGAA